MCIGVVRKDRRRDEGKDDGQIDSDSGGDGDNVSWDMAGMMAGRGFCASIMGGRWWSPRTIYKC